MEYKTPLICTFDCVPALVDQSVMMAAEKYQVFQGGMAALRPVLYVVTVAEAVIRGAARKPAALVPDPPA